MITGRRLRLVQLVVILIGLLQLPVFLGTLTKNFLRQNWNSVVLLLISEMLVISGTLYAASF